MGVRPSKPAHPASQEEKHGPAPTARQPIRGRAAIRRAYEDEQLADDYVHSRYEDDRFGRVLHAAQIDVLRRVLHDKCDAPILEVACGPARLTAELPDVRRGLALDGSRAMITIAARRLGERGVRGWRLLCGDAFELPFTSGRFEVLLSFKLIRHFDAAGRAALLREFARVLKPGGMLLLDVAHKNATEWLHKKWGVPGSWVDDYYFDASSLRAEVEREPFRVDRLHAIQRPIALQYLVDARVAGRWPRVADTLSRTVNRLPFGQPLEWIAQCRRA
jgi:ubiquinone/menaquinone biosynthesis C-methylase UbiE